ncbi:MAG: tetratricopeptide repeat protein, partial [Polyangiales bacterium]
MCWSGAFCLRCARAVAAFMLCCTLGGTRVAADARAGASAQTERAPQPPTQLAPLVELVEQGRYLEAEPRLRASLASGPGARFWLIRLLIETGRYAEARTQAALMADQGKSLALRAAADTGLAEAWLAEGELDSAERALRSAVAADPDALRAQVLLGRLLWQRGQRDAATRELTGLASRPHSPSGLRRVASRARAEELRYVAMAARALGRMHEANDTFREAAELDRAKAETQLEWAELFLEKSDLRHAAESVQAALAENPNSARAQLLAARVAFWASGDLSTAAAAVDRALGINPQLAAAHVLRAAMALRESDLLRAHEALDRALAINPADLEALSTRAAAYFLAGDTASFNAIESQVLALNPRYGRLYGTVAEYAEWEHRYAEIAGLFKRGLRIDPDDASLHAGLGLGLLRMGEEKPGLAALHAAWARDRFNVQVFNVLNLYEGAIRTGYEELPVGPFKVRLHRGERAALQPYLAPLLRRAHAQLRKRWGFTPAGPLRVELYADREQFSVRTTGLPHAGVQGVSFGKVVVGLSPRGGPFNWGQIVWHEVSHVFHLQLSKHRVPRWFTEGLAEYETALARPEWKREDDPILWQALRAGRLPPLAAMNRAFTQARSPDELMAGYFFAYRAVEHIVERFGFPSVRKLLVALGEGQSLEAASQRAFGQPLEAIDESFRRALAVRLARYEREFAPELSAYEEPTASTMVNGTRVKVPFAELAAHSGERVGASAVSTPAGRGATPLTAAAGGTSHSGDGPGGPPPAGADALAVTSAGSLPSTSARSSTSFAARPRPLPDASGIVPTGEAVMRSSPARPETVGAADGGSAWARAATSDGEVAWPAGRGAAAGAAVRREGASSEALATTSLAELHAGRVDAAASAAQAALRAGPSQPLALFASARVALVQNDPLKAERLLLELVRLGADGYTVRLLLAQNALTRQKPQLALE